MIPVSITRVGCITEPVNDNVILFKLSLLEISKKVPGYCPANIWVTEGDADALAFSSSIASLLSVKMKFIDSQFPLLLLNFHL